MDIDTITQAAIWRSIKYGDRLYSFRLVFGDTISYGILSHNTPCIRETIAGGNAGMGHQSIFAGNPRGVHLEIRGTIESVVPLEDLVVAHE